MALRREYDGQICPLARSLEVIGERWTLLILRDAFYGITRFSDFRSNLGLPPAVLSERLRLLVEHEILATVPMPGAREEYRLTEKGEELWPAIWSLMYWGREHYLEDGLRRTFVHADCEGQITASGACDRCGLTPGPRDIVVLPRPSKSSGESSDGIGGLMLRPHRLLQPLRDSD